MVSMLVLCANAWAEPYFFEDFSDGNPTDGSPINWLPAWGVDATGYVLTHRDLLSDGVE